MSPDQMQSLVPLLKSMYTIQCTYRSLSRKQQLIEQLGVLALAGIVLDKTVLHNGWLSSRVALQ